MERLINMFQKNSSFASLANEFLHDYKTFIYTIRRYLELKDFEGMDYYLVSLESYSTPLLNHCLLEQVYNINNRGIQGVLINAIEQCDNHNIKLILDIQEIPNHCFFSTIDFTRCFSILVNNALEQTTGKIHIQFSQSNETVFCIVRNTYDGFIDLEKIFNKHFSTKANHQGLGLSILKKLISSYPHTTITVHPSSNWISFSITTSAIK